MFYIRKSGTKIGDLKRELITATRGSGSVGHLNAILNNTPLSERKGGDAMNSSQDRTSLDNSDNESFYKLDIAIMALQVFACFLITFVVFPGTSLSTKFDFLGTTNRDFAWFAVLMITLFNLFDTIGRFAGGYKQIFTPNTVFALTVFRLIFIPTFVLIQVKANPAWIFQSDWFRIFNMALFALTNGYNSTLCMIYGPTLVSDKNKERAGLIMSFHLVGGIFAGALIASFGMDKIPK